MAYYRIDFGGDEDLERRYAEALQRAMDYTKQVKEGKIVIAEPVAWMFQGAFDISTYVSFEKPNPDIYPNPTPLYTHPAQKPMMVLDGNRVYPAFKELTDEEIDFIFFDLPSGHSIQEFARAILRKAQEK